MNPSASASTLWPSDLTRVCERLASRIAGTGASHPVAAAAVLAARGHSGLDQPAFAEGHGLPLAALRRAEAGQVAWEDLPDIIGDLLEAMPSIHLLALADLDAALRADGVAAEVAD